MCPSGFGCQNRKKDSCHNLIQEYQTQVDENSEMIEEEFNISHDPQILRHMVLLILLLCSMFVVRILLLLLFKNALLYSQIFIIT